MQLFWALIIKILNNNSYYNNSLLRFFCLWSPHRKTNSVIAELKVPAHPHFSC
jgi:hypothetical protein